MPFRNTNYAKNKGYSACKPMMSDNKKNYRAKTGKYVNSSVERLASYKAPWKGSFNKKS